VVIGIALLFRAKCQLEEYALLPDSTIKEPFAERLRNDLVRDINDFGIPGIQVSIITGKENDFSIGAADYESKIQNYQESYSASGKYHQGRYFQIG